MLHIVRGALWGCLEEPSPPCCPIRTCWFGGPSPPIPLPGAGSRSAGLLQRPGMQTLAFIEGKRLRLHETLPWMPRHPIKGCSTETKCVGVLFPLSPRSPSRFGLGLSARSRGSGKLAASPAPPGARAPSDVVCPKHSSVGKKKKKKKRLVDTVVLDHQALLLPRSTRHPQFVPGCPVLFTPGCLRGEADAFRGLHPEVWWKVLDGCAALPASPACTTGRGRSHPAAPGRLVLTCR